MNTLKTLILIALILFSGVIPSFAVHIKYSVSTIGVDSINGVDFSQQLLTLEDILDKKPREIEEASGQKMTLKQKIVLRLAKKRVKKAQKKGYEPEILQKEAEGDFDFSWPAFLLGFLLSLFGVIVATILLGKKGCISSLIGFGLWGLIAFLIFL